MGKGMMSVNKLKMSLRSGREIDFVSVKLLNLRLMVCGRESR